MATDMPDVHRKANEGMGRVIEQIADDQWEVETPNPGWSVRILVQHVVSGSVWVAPLLAGETIEQVGDRFDGDLLGEDPKAAWRAASAEAVTACLEPGAMERIVHLSSGPTQALNYIHERTADLGMHTWDLARTIGADETIDPEVVEVGRSLLAAVGELWRQYGALGPIIETAPDADEQTIFLAESGRRA
jgi:uncharacterized protein (TIGR03086 family)